MVWCEHEHVEARGKKMDGGCWKRGNEDGKKIGWMGMKGG
jgi:hypothetical protein